MHSHPGKICLLDPDRLPRKLVAILYADVADYSRLTGEDEDATHRRLSEYLDFISSRVAHQHGRVMHYAGDAVLAMFEAVADALSCASAIQKDLEERNADLPKERKLQFRIGVNLGDVIEDRGDIYGEGVNVAARLESLAEPGGICISESVRTAIGKKLLLDYESMGEQQVKNIEEPVRAYRVHLEARTASPSNAPSVEISAKPSIAVLPFTNMSGDPEQEYFSDGITEEITTALARNRPLAVIAWHSAFAYKGKAVDIRQIANELGCRYVVEGSVRRSDHRVRINAQLIEADTGNHLWAERYERQLEDVFAVQDEIALSIAGAIDPELGASESKRARAKAPDNLGAWDYYQQGVWHMYRFTVEGLAEAKTLLERAIDLDENFAAAYARLSYVHYQRTWYGPHESRDDSLRQALACAKRAVTLDDKDALGHFALGRIYALQGQHDMAIAELESAIDLNPSFSDAYLMLGLVLTQDGRPEEAIPVLETTMRLSPNSPLGFAAMANLGRAHLHMKKFDEAKRWTEMAIRHSPAADWSYLVLLCSLGHLGLGEEARAVRQTYLGRRPAFSIGDVPKRMPYRRHEDLELMSDGLRKAGLPE